MNDDISSLLNEIDSSVSISPKTDIDNKDIKKQIDVENLFDIKKLNSIEDKMVRGMAKKIYMSGKRSEKKSKEVLEEITSAINDAEKMDDDIASILKDIL